MTIGGIDSGLRRNDGWGGRNDDWGIDSGLRRNDGWGIDSGLRRNDGLGVQIPGWAGMTVWGDRFRVGPE